jgi:hypothetical protein
VVDIDCVVFYLEYRNVAVFIKSNSGQGMNEYALIGGLVVIGAIVTLGVVGNTVSDLMGSTIGAPPK